MKSRPLFRIATFLVLFAILMVFGSRKTMRDPGTFWHTRIGQDILDGKGLPTVDTFSYTRAGEPWICQYWLADAAFAALYATGGWSALVVVTVCSIAFTFAWLGSRLRDAGLAPIVAVTILAYAMAASSSQFLVRPIFATLCLMAWTVVRLLDVESGRASPRSLWATVPAFALWANLHGGVLGGLVSFAMVISGWIVLHLMGQEGPLRDRKAVVQAIGLTFAAFSAVLANPYGFRLPELWFSILSLPLHELIQEHARLWRAPGALAMTILLACMFVVVWVSAPARFRKPVAALPWFWLLQAFLHVRHASLFAVVTLAVIADILPGSGVAAVLTRRGWMNGTSEHRQPPSRKGLFSSSRLLPAAVAAGVVSTALILQSRGIRAPWIGADQVRIDPKYWPTELLPQLRAIVTEIDEPRLYNDMLYGGFLIFHVPDLPVFIDDRCELYGLDFLRRYVELARGSTGEFDELDARYGFTHVLIDKSGKLRPPLEASSLWRPLGETESVILYERKQGDSP